MRTFHLLAAMVALLLGSSVSGQGEEEWSGLGGVAGDDDPRIFEDEVMAPAMDSRDPSWTPAYEWHEDPASLDCEARRGCEDYKEREVNK